MPLGFVLHHIETQVHQVLFQPIGRARRVGVVIAVGADARNPQQLAEFVFEPRAVVF